MAEIFNLRRARKAKTRSVDEAAAAAHRIRHGTPKNLRAAAKIEKARAARAIDAHKLEDGSDDD